MSLRTSLPIAALALATSLLALSALRAQAQAEATATKTISLDVFGGVTYLNTEFDGSHGEVGFVVGGDITRHFRFADLSLEARYTTANGTLSDESSYGGGIKAERQYRRYHPYVDFLVGDGVIHFDHPELVSGPGSTYTHDDSFIYVFGGGVDYDITSHFAIKADAQIQTWKIGQEHPRFTPYNASIGILYRIPFRNLRK